MSRLIRLIKEYKRDRLRFKESLNKLMEYEREYTFPKYILIMWISRIKDGVYLCPTSLYGGIDWYKARVWKENCPHYGQRTQCWYIIVMCLRGYRRKWMNDLLIKELNTLVSVV